MQNNSKYAGKYTLISLLDFPSLLPLKINLWFKRVDRHASHLIHPVSGHKCSLYYTYTISLSLTCIYIPLL